jgi:hypothetical protein
LFVTLPEMARITDRLRTVPRPIKVGLWLGSAGALLYAMTLLTHGRTDREWMSPPRPSQGAIAAALEPPDAPWKDAPATASPAPSTEAVTAEPSGTPEAPRQAAAEPVAPPAVVQAGRTQSRGMNARRSRRAASRHAREPIQYRLADRPGL